jgi:hypothetical protein
VLVSGTKRLALTVIALWEKEVIHLLEGLSENDI